jgi:hypothetical protein
MDEDVLVTAPRDIWLRIRTRIAPLVRSALSEAVRDDSDLVDSAELRESTERMRRGEGDAEHPKP